MTDFEKYKELFPERFPFSLFNKVHCSFPNALHVENSDKVYRIAISGAIDEAFFLPSILEDRNRTRYSSTHIGTISLADWSVSCYTIEKHAEKILGILKKHNPPSLLTVGIISEGTGLWACSKDWNAKNKDSHVDWWIFDGKCPVEDFKVI